MNERIKRPPLSIITGIIKLLAFFAGLIIVTVAASSLMGRDLPDWVKYFVYLVFAALSATVILRLMTEYGYTVKGNRLIIERYIFKQPKRIAAISLSDISYIGRYLPRSYSGRIIKATYKSGKTGVIYLIYNFGEKSRCVIISPSKKMFDVLTSGRES